MTSKSFVWFRRGMLWFSAPTSLNNDMLNDGELHENIMKRSIGRSEVLLDYLVWGTITPRACFIRAIRKGFGRHA